VSSNTPLSSAGDGRLSDGRFTKGNRIGKGNPWAKQVQELRAAFFKVCTPERMEALVEKLIQRAEHGKVNRTTILIIQELADRTIGRPSQCDLESRLAAIEEHLDHGEDDE
jgi:hypothetical protein